LKDSFAGTQRYYAEARISSLQLFTGSNPLDPTERIKMCRSLIANKPNVMAFETRNSLRELYHQVGKEADSMIICNQLFAFKPNDEYLVNVLSDWQLFSDNKQALANLLQRARTYNDLPCVRAACLLAAADLYVTAKQNSSAEKVYSAILQDKSASAEPYRIVAQVSLNLLHDTYTAK
jgi:predicted Zn-dependent protease